MALVRRAREQRPGPFAAPPAPSEPEQPPAQEIRREVLLGYRELAALPTLSEIVEVGNDNLRQQRIERRDREQFVENGLRAGLVEGLRGSREFGSSELWIEWCGGGPPSRRRRGRLDGQRCSRSECCRFPGGETVGDVPRHQPDAFEIVERIEAQAAGRTRRVQKSVAPLPGAQQLGAHAGAPAQLADSKRRFVAHVAHDTGPVQNLDKRPNAANLCCVLGQQLYK